MRSTVGIFESRSAAERAVEDLVSTGIAQRNIDLLTPGDTQEELRAVATTEAEQPGMGKALGGVVGGAIGAAGGLHLGAVGASLLVPGVGPIIATGILGAALFGIGGAAGGAAAGDALDERLAQGLPRDEMYVYEDALRRGRSVVIVVGDDEQLEKTREVFKHAGAETIDSARDQWWIGLRDAEEETYRAQGRDFSRDEPVFRNGFEAALHPDVRGKTFDESRPHLTRCYGAVCDDKPFQAGFERGYDYDRRLRHYQKEQK